MFNSIVIIFSSCANDISTSASSWLENKHENYSLLHKIEPNDMIVYLPGIDVIVVYLWDKNVLIK